MKQHRIVSTAALVGLLLGLSLSVILVGCLKQQRDHNSLTDPAAQSSKNMYLSLAQISGLQAKATGLTITATSDDTGTVVDSRSFANPLFPIHTEFLVETPPCVFTITATATLEDGSTQSASAGVDACTIGGAAINLSVVTELPTPTPTPTTTPTGNPTPTPTIISTNTLSVSKTGSGTGVVLSSDSEISCGSTCDATYEKGMTVTLSALPNGNSTFTGWSGDCSGTGTCTVTIDGEMQVTAQFTAQFALDVSTTGSGAGAVTSTDGGINCGTTCSKTYNSGDTVTLTASPATGSVFTEWSGDCSGSSSCSVKIQNAATVTAQFDAEWTVTVTTTGNGTGTVGGDGMYVEGSLVSLTATPGTETTLTWSGVTCNAGQATSPCEFTLGSGDVTATATFALNTYTVSAVSSPSGAGTFTGDGTYDYDQNVSLSVTANAGYTFDTWSGVTCAGGATANPCQFTMGNSDVTATANFTANTYTVSASASPTAGGSVAGAGPYAFGDLVSLGASANSGYVFSNWSGVTCNAGSTTSPCKFTQGAGNVTVTATFMSCLAAGPKTVGGAKWYKGNKGCSCDEVCSAAGKTYDTATRSYAGDQGTNANCENVAVAFGQVWKYTYNVTGMGCFQGPAGDGNGAYRTISSPTTSNASSANRNRYCACQ